MVVVGAAQLFLCAGIGVTTLTECYPVSGHNDFFIALNLDEDVEQLA